MIDVKERGEKERIQFRVAGNDRGRGREGLVSSRSEIVCSVEQVERMRKKSFGAKFILKTLHKMMNDMNNEATIYNTFPCKSKTCTIDILYTHCIVTMYNVGIPTSVYERKFKRYSAFYKTVIKTRVNYSYKA